MSVTTNSGDAVKVVFVYQKDEEVEEVKLNNPELTALLHAKQVWIGKFGRNLKIEHTVWSYGEEAIALQIYLK